jgi:hypothetical protein
METGFLYPGVMRPGLEDKHLLVLRVRMSGTLLLFRYNNNNNLFLLNSYNTSAYLLINKCAIYNLAWNEKYNIKSNLQERVCRDLTYGKLPGSMD